VADFLEPDVFIAQRHYLTVHGTFFGGIETWQFGLWLSDGGLSNEVTAPAAAPVIEEWWALSDISRR
jgi:hypothetical protein